MFGVSTYSLNETKVTMTRSIILLARVSLHDRGRFRREIHVIGDLTVPLKRMWYEYHHAHTRRIRRA